MQEKWHDIDTAPFTDCSATVAVPSPSIIPAARPKAPRSDRLLRGLMSRTSSPSPSSVSSMFLRVLEDLKREWPDKLRDVGTVAQLAVATLDQKAADTSDAIFNLNKRDIARVYALYREYRLIGRHRLALPALTGPDRT